jgi:hypothetical protein
MNKKIAGLFAMVVAASGSGVGAQVAGGGPLCQGVCGTKIVFSIQCARLQVCCGPVVKCTGPNQGYGAGTCCPSSPLWCCYADFDENLEPVAFCYECDPA